MYRQEISRFANRRYSLTFVTVFVLLVLVAGAWGQESAHPFAMEKSNGDVNVFYPGTDNNLHMAYWNPGPNPQWLDFNSGHPIVGNASAIEDTNGIPGINIAGSVRIYYGSSDGNLHELGWNPQTLVWGDYNTKLPISNSPSAVLDVNGTVRIYYHDRITNNVQEYSLDQYGWHLATIGTQPITGSPYAMVKANGDINVFYQDAADHNLHMAYLNYGTTSWLDFNSNATITDNPTAVEAVLSNPNNVAKTLRIYFRGNDANHSMYELAWIPGATPGTGSFSGPWNSGRWMNNTASAIQDHSGTVRVFYNDSGPNALEQDYLDGAGWHPPTSTNCPVCGQQHMTGSPSAITKHDGSVNIYYRDSDDGLLHIIYSGTDVSWWYDQGLFPMAATTPPPNPPSSNPPPPPPPTGSDVCTPQASVNVTTYHNDNCRTGQNLEETILTPANVNGAQFGKLFSRGVRGDIYAQPLYVSNLYIPQNQCVDYFDVSPAGTHNGVVFVATEQDWVYAFDADTGQCLWSADLIDTAHGGTSGETAVPIIDVGCSNINPWYGITSTPVIDINTNTVYVEAKSRAVDPYGNDYFVHRLHALNIADGSEKSQGPRQISGSSSGVSFDSRRQQNRPGLLLMNGIIYIGFASHCDNPTYHGWIFAYDANSFLLQGIYVTTPNSSQGGIWMSGAGLAGDGTNLFVATGNGYFNNSTDLGDSIIKLSLNGGLNATDYFTPYDQNFMNQKDMDLGSGGVLLLPGLNELVQTGKEGTIYVVDRNHMGGHLCDQFTSYCTSDTQIVQELKGAIGGNANLEDELFGMPAYWNNRVYFFGVNDHLKSFFLSNGRLGDMISSQDIYGLLGSTPSISANGASNGIVWSLGNPSDTTSREVLRAHDALNLSLLYSSDQYQDPTHDNPGNPIKFAVPTVANGKVYVGAVDQLSVYSLLPPNSASLSSQSVPSPMVAGQTYSVSVTMLNIGTSTWTSSAYNLGSLNPRNNTTWGPLRAALPNNSVPPGAQATFTFNVTAPSQPGTYNFQWGMLQEGIQWFGDSTGTPVIVCGVPGASTNVVGSANGSGQITVTWNPPANNGGCPVTAYGVDVYSAATGSSQTLSTSTNSAIITGLTPNTYYTFTVTAWNGASWGAWSNWSPWVLAQ